jgi:hypothetical protein
MAYQDIQNDIVPPLIENEHRDNYLKAINDKGDLCEFIDGSIINNLELIGL